MSKRFLMVLVAFLTIGMQAFAQTTVTGKVTDPSGEAVLGAGVQVKGTSTGTVTDLDGAYKLAGVDSKSVLVFSCIGYKTVEVTVGSQKTINVVLAEDSEFLDDVVVIGYGTARKKDVSGAIASMNFASDKNSASLPNPTALSALSSKVAGFSYAPTSSASGDNTASMTIRGKNSIPGSPSASSQSVNQPLLVVDGVISYDSINSINTADIQSIDVLKDASAAAIYGSRAANGVIIITTKRGASEKPIVSFNASVSLSDWARMPKMVTDETTFFKNRFYSKQANDASLEGMDPASYDKAQLFVTSVEQDAYNQGKRTNWLKEISRTGVGQKYDLSISGRSKNTNYYVSGDYTRQQGILKGDDYSKYTFLAKMDMNVTDWLTVGIKANYLGSKSWGVPGRIQNATWMTPYSFTNSQLQGFESWPNSKPDGSTISPLWGTGAGDSNLWTSRSSNASNLNGVAYAQIDFPFLKGLSYRFTMQGQRNDSASDTFNRPEIWVSTTDAAEMTDPLKKYGTNVEGTSATTHSSYWNMDHILTYAKDFGKNHIDAMIGYTREKSWSEGLSTTFKGFSSPIYLEQYSQNAAESISSKRGRTEQSSIGYLARLNYNYASKYYVTGTFRRDGYSGFAAGHKWGNFFGASAAWVISNENFIRDNVQWIDFLKLRLSWGQNGARNISPYSTLSTVAATVANSGAMTHYWLGGEKAYGVAPTGLPNRALTWATVEKYDLGIDFSVLGGRLNGSIDAYMGNTWNMLVNRSAPYITGATSTLDNVGRVSNNGIEIVLNSVNIAGDGQDKFRWETGLVFDTNANKVVSLYGKNWKGEENPDVGGVLQAGFDTSYALVPGYPISAAYDLTKLGIFQSDDEAKNYKNAQGEMIQPGAKAGDIKFLDLDGDGKINDNDRSVIGCMDPLFTMNLSNTLSWKGFSLYFNFRWGQGDKTHFLGYDPNAFATSMGSGAQLAAVKPWVNDAYNQNLSTVYPRYGYVNSLNYNFWNSRSYLKLKDLSFSYTIPEKACKSIGLAGLRIYVAGTDLFCISNWSGLDPETGGTIAAGAASSRYGANGTYKTYTMGVNISF